jgi:DinB superfamily
MDNPSVHLAGRLRSEGLKTLEFFRGLEPAEWDQEVYTEGACWKVRQVFAHQVASEISLRRLFENILAGGPGSPEDFRLNEYNERRVEKLEGMDIETLYQQFAEQRESNAVFVAGLTAADLQRTGRHPFLGVATLEEMIKLLYRHNQIHMREIRKRNSVVE